MGMTINEIINTLDITKKRITELKEEYMTMELYEFSKFAGILSAALSQHYLLGFEIAQLEFHHLHYLCS